MSEKTEDATPQKLKDSRKKGQIAKSQKITLGFGLAGGALGLIIAMSVAKPYVIDSVRESFGVTQTLQNDNKYWIKMLLVPVLSGVLPLFLAIAAGVILATVLQTKGLISFEQMKPKWELLSGISYFKRFATMKPIVDSLLMLAFSTCLLGLAYWLFKGQLAIWLGSFGISAQNALTTSSSLMIKVISYFTLIVLSLGAVDFAYQYFQFLKDQRMTKDEVKREYKNQEGDPLIKGIRMRIAREIANSPQSRNFKNATLVVTNPTHLAIVLQADKDHPIPFVIMKGAGREAFEIRQAAKRAKVPVVEHRPLARKLMATNAVNTPIPRETYSLVATLLVSHSKSFVSEMQKQAKSKSKTASRTQ
jgi:flagellar biosynthesis protein FlhB